MSDEKRDGPQPFVPREERERQWREFKEWLATQPEDVQKQLAPYVLNPEGGTKPDA
jgi:hypothetical protein